MPAFSVIIPVFNRENVISRAIKSIQAQTFTDWELIIIDDGSDDGTEQVVKGFLKDERISYT